MNELSLYILDICQNSLAAGCKNLSLYINENSNNNTLSITVIDDGKGMSEAILKKVTDPFYTTRTTRKVGLGIPLFKELSEQCDGSFNIKSKIGEGTTVTSEFRLNHIDLPPMGNLEDTLFTISTYDESVNVNFTYINNEKKFTFSTEEIKKILDGVLLNEPSIVIWFKEFIHDGLKNILD